MNKYKINDQTKQLLNFIENKFGAINDYVSDQNGSEINEGPFHNLNDYTYPYGFEVKRFDDAYDGLDYDLMDRGYTTPANLRADKRFRRIDDEPYSDHRAVIIYDQNRNPSGWSCITSDDPFIIMRRNHLRVRLLTTKDLKIIEDYVNNSENADAKKKMQKYVASFEYTSAYTHKLQAKAKKTQQKQKKANQKYAKTRKNYLNHLGTKHSKEQREALQRGYDTLVSNISMPLNTTKGFISNHGFKLNLAKYRSSILFILNLWDKDTYEIVKNSGVSKRDLREFVKGDLNIFGISANKARINKGTKKYHQYITITPQDVKKWIDSLRNAIERHHKSITLTKHQEMLLFEALFTFDNLVDFDKQYHLLTDDQDGALNKLEQQLYKDMEQNWNPVEPYRTFQNWTVKKFGVIKPIGKRITDMNIVGADTALWYNTYDKFNKVTKKYFIIQDGEVADHNSFAYWSKKEDGDKNLDNQTVNKFENRITDFFGEGDMDKAQGYKKYVTTNKNSLLIIYPPRKYHPGTRPLKKRDLKLLKPIFDNWNDKAKRTKAIKVFSKTL